VSDRRRRKKKSRKRSPRNEDDLEKDGQPPKERVQKKTRSNNKKEDSRGLGKMDPDPVFFNLSNSDEQIVESLVRDNLIDIYVDEDGVFYYALSELGIKVYKQMDDEHG